MSKAKQGSSVMVHYKGTLNDGSVFDSSEGGEPLAFTIGACQVIAGFEEAVIGMTQGETKTVVITADQAYGPHVADMVIDVDRSQFPEHITPEIGQVMQLRVPDSDPVRVMITGISESKITLDANHPMAGKDLTFEIQLIEIV
jgi:peptidylprolyl isomerase